MKEEIIFLTQEDVVEMHNYQIQNFGGSPGLRDANMLDSALAMPYATFGGTYLHGSIEEMATAYLFHLVENHPFIDGNKRVGTMATLVFLDINGYEFTADDDELTQVVLNIALGKMPKSDIASFIKSNCRV